MGRYLQPIAPERVPAAVRDAGLAAYRWAVRDLGLSPQPLLVWAEAGPGVSWDEKHRDGGVYVATDDPLGAHIRRGQEPSRIFIVSAGQTPAGVAATVLHECRHVWQAQNGWPSAVDNVGVRYADRGSEKDAAAYERRAARLVSPSGSWVVPEWRPPSALAETIERWIAAVVLAAGRGEGA